MLPIGNRLYNSLPGVDLAQLLAKVIFLLGGVVILHIGVGCSPTPTNVHLSART